MGDGDRTARLRDEQMHYRDWGWVEEWRAQGEKPAWGPGVALAVFAAVLVAVALIVLTSGLADTPWLAICVNLVVAAGMAPALWLSRALPVLRFLAAGAAGGLVLGWLCMLAIFPHWS
jgi:O-antigen ligase